MTILITGASGFIGSHVMAELKGWPLRLLVQPGDPDLPELRREHDVVVGDVTHPESLPAALQGVSQVVHMAGSVNGGRGPMETFRAVNAQGTANLARAAGQAGIEQLVYPSSITVYGHVRDADETYPLVRTPGYPESKIEAEAALREELGERVTILRLPLVLGAGDKGFMEPALQGFRQAGAAIVVGSGKEPWSILSAVDAARAIHLALDRPETRGQIYNVVGETILNGDLLRAMGSAAGSTRDIHLPYPIGWTIGALSELTGRGGMTRDQIKALSRPMSMDGQRFQALGFAAKQSWQEALAEAAEGGYTGADGVV